MHHAATARPPLSESNITKVQDLQQPQSNAIYAGTSLLDQSSVTH